MTRRGVAIALSIVAFGAAGCSDDDTGGTARPAEPSAPTTLLALPEARPGDIVGLAADDDRGIVTWLHRIDGTVYELDLDPASGSPPSLVATVPISTDSQQGGLLDQVLLPGGRRVLTWTTPDTNELVAGVLPPEAPSPIVFWSAGEAGSGAIGGKLDITDDGRLLVSVGRNTDFDAIDGDGGALLAFELDLLAGLADGDRPTPTEISRGYTNPWAFESLADGEIWVWDNAAGADPDDPDLDDAERIGRADLEADRNQMFRSEVSDRAPAAMVELPDGRIGVCGFLDNELRAYEVVDSDDGPRTRLDRAGTVMACNTAATVFADGTIVTAAQTDAGETLQVLRP